MFEDDNRTLKRGRTIKQRYNKTIVAKVTGVHGFCTPARGIGTLGFASGAIFPHRVYERHGPHHSVQQLYNVMYHHWWVQQDSRTFLIDKLLIDKLYKNS